MIRTLLFITAIVAVPFSAHAETKKALADWTCSDFTGAEDVLKPKIVYWASGAAKAGEPKATTIDIVETEKVIPFVTEVCKKNPQAPFWNTLKAEWRKLERAAKSLEKKL